MESRNNPDIGDIPYIISSGRGISYYYTQQLSRTLILTVTRLNNSYFSKKKYIRYLS